MYARMGIRLSTTPPLASGRTLVRDCRWSGRRDLSHHDDALRPDNVPLTLLAFHDDHGVLQKFCREGDRKGLSRRSDESRVVVDAHRNRLGGACFLLRSPTGDDVGRFSLGIRADPNDRDLLTMLEQCVEPLGRVWYVLRFPRPGTDGVLI